MERIIRMAVLFGIVTVSCFFAIIIARGSLTWSTIGIICLVALVIGFGVGVWTLVHNTFSRPVEIGLTIGIICLAMVILFLVAATGREMFYMVSRMIGNYTAWWLVAPAIGTGAISAVFGLHSRR